jgi:hypothetical protein
MEQRLKFKLMFLDESLFCLYTQKHFVMKNLVVTTSEEFGDQTPTLPRSVGL